MRSSVAVESDEEGRFDAPAAPAGDVVFEVNQAARFRVEGFYLPPGGSAEVTITVDVGGAALAGTVVNESDVPIPGARVVLVRSREVDGLRTSSLRHAVTDAAGVFRFRNVGQGSHNLSASAAGYEPRKVACEVQGEQPVAVIRLPATDGER
jgi:hypothetical protein